MIKIWGHYVQNIRGHFAVQFALLGLPLVVATTFVVDYSQAGTEKVNVKSALDAAVIAAVNNNSLTQSGKVAYAKTHFNENYSGEIDFDLTATASASRVEMSAFGLSPVTVAETLGIEGIQIFEKSSAEQTHENVICALSTAPDGRDRITFRGNSTFLAPSCSVHANSDDVRAMRVVGNASAHAKSFCAVGGASGAFQPYAKGECAPVADPYANYRAPEPGPCLNIGGISDIRSLVGSTGRNDDDDDDDDDEREGQQFGGDEGRNGGNKNNLGGAVENLTGDNISLPPGTYCGGLTIDGRNVRFLPGNHIILDGPLIFRNNAEAIGEDVTFVMNGLASVLTVQSGADVDITAPPEGSKAGMPGMAFFQDVQTQLGNDGKFPNGENKLSSGGNLNITGTAYFPTQSVKITSNAVFGSRAPATSFVAYELQFGGASTINVAVDHERADLPPIMPRTEDGARLTE